MRNVVSEVHYISLIDSHMGFLRLFWVSGPVECVPDKVSGFPQNLTTSVSTYQIFYKFQFIKHNKRMFS